MHIKRSFFKAFLASATVGLLLASCTIKESSGDECEKGDRDSGCRCPDGAVGYQVCGSDGVFGSCQCPDAPGTAGSKNTSGSSNSSGGDDGGGSGGTNGGTTSTETGGSGDGGSTEAVGGGGEGGAPFTINPEDFDPEDCTACLQQLCQSELSACLDDTRCFSEEGDGSGQYERISLCIERERINGVVKRDAVRGCGVTIGISPDADLAADWAPEGMAPATTNLLNCLATSGTETPNADWANSDDNFPIIDDMIVPTPWPEDSCAKLGCTSKL